MSRAAHPPSNETSEREALRRRVKQLYECFNRGLWERCFALIDPRLRSASKVDSADYANSLQAFKETYGAINPWYIRISVHVDSSSNKHDARPFANVYVVWQDAVHGFHMFRERWVKESGRWFTRVVGLVPNRQGSVRGEK
jgi:hypothetical protein